MGWTVSVFTTVVFGSAVVAMAVGLMALRHRPDPIAWPLSVLMFAVVAWSVPYAISLGYADIDHITFWYRLRYPGIAIAPVAYLIVALKYAGYDRWLSRRTYAALVFVPIATTIIVWTNPIHGLYWQSLSLVRIGGASVLIETFGPWRPVNVGYLYLITAIGLLVFGSVVIRSDPIYRTQALTMFVGGVVPLATNVANTIGYGPDPGFDFTAPALSVTGLTFALALFHLDLLELRPIARDRLIDELDDGVVVIGPDNRIRDFNQTAADILGGIAVDQPAETVLPSDVASDGGELVIETEAGERRFRMRSTPLTDEHDQQIGRIVYLNDVTALVEREQRITVLNRILRHNIRNELNVVSGYLEMVEAEESDTDPTHLQMAKESADRVIEFAEKARNIERTLQRSDTTMAVSAPEIATRVVTDIQDQYDDAVIEYESTIEPGDDASVRVVDTELFEMVLVELIENAIVHNDQVSPRVTVSVEFDNDQVQISIADNGPGIPKQETDVLLSRTETHLEHSSGIGLWLVAWTTRLSSGDLSFANNDPRGTIVTLSFPSAAE